MTEVKMPSGAKLKIGVAPFAEARTLYQAILEELRVVTMDPKAEIDVMLFKELFCVFLSSKKIENALEAVSKRCLYCDKRGDLKIDGDTFEPVEAREDYIEACVEIAKAAIFPFGKSLYAQYGHVLDRLKKDLV